MRKIELKKEAVMRMQQLEAEMGIMRQERVSIYADRIKVGKKLDSDSHWQDSLKKKSKN